MNNLEGIENILLKREVKQLQILADSAKEYDLTITIENLDKNSSGSYLTYTDTPVKIMEVVSEVNSENIGLTYDFAHSYLADKNRFKENSKFAAIHASHLHLSDNFGFPERKDMFNHRKSFLEGDLHLPLGKGRNSI